MPQKVILDVDTGGDDAAAILLAGHHPALELVAVCAVHGNAPLAVTLDNTLRVMTAGRLEGVPVYRGAAAPLVGPFAPLLDTQREVLPLPATALQPQNRRAVDFLIDYYMGPHGPETVYVPLGSQTNLALALRMEPRLAKRIPRIVTMAGAYIEGNTTPSAEFNILADPEAAHIVFTAGIPITMIGLEVTAQAFVSLADVERVRQIGTPWAQAAAVVMERDTRWFIEHLGRDEGQIFDACAVASVIDPGLTRTQAMHVAIELTGRHTRGRTVADISGRHAGSLPPNVDVGVHIDRQQFLKILMEGLH